MAMSMTLVNAPYTGIIISTLFRSSEYNMAVRSNSQDSAKLYFLVQGAEDEITAVGAVASTEAMYEEGSQTLTGVVPTSYADAPRMNVFVDDRVNNTIWVVAVEYLSTSDSRKDGQNDHNFTFEVTSVNKHLVRAISTTKYVSSENSHGFINDGEGVDINFPVASFSETHYYSNSSFSSVKSDILHTVGRINQSTFRGYSAKNVLLLSASGSRRGVKAEDKWQVTFNFALQLDETVSGLKYWNGSSWSTLSNFTVQGWDYLWFRTKEYPRTLTSLEDISKKEKRIIGVFVSQVYQTASYSFL